MAAKPVTHPSPEVLQAYGLGKDLDEAMSESVKSHLDTCADCLETVATVSGDNFLGRTAQGQGRGRHGVGYPAGAGQQYETQPSSST